MFWQKKKYIVRLLNQAWEQMGILKVKVVPNKGDFIYIEEMKKYFEILSVVHYVNKNHGIFLIINTLNQQTGVVEKIN